MTIRLARLIGGIVIAMSAMLPAGGRAQEIGRARVVPIQVTGDAAARFSLVVLGDGYTEAGMGTFRAHVEKHLDILWSIEPFRSYRNYVNVYAVEIVSGEAGITCDPATREHRATPLAMRFDGGCENPNARSIAIDQEAARMYARMATPDYDQVLAIANTGTYGGIGGSIATTSGGNALGPYITPHELGHSLGRLQDEYTYRERGVAGDAYTGGEPASIHHTLFTEEDMRAQQRKWWRWLGEPSEAGGVIGRFDGGMYRISDISRPSRHSMMISLGYYFDQVHRERMTQRISGQVELISASTPTDAPISPSSVVWIETAHPVYHELDVTWQIDGRAVPDAAGRRSLDLRTLGVATAGHTLTVKAVDPTPFVRDPMIRDTSLTATRSWTIDPSATIDESPVPVAFTASTATTRPAGAEEVVYVETTHPHDRVLDVSWRLDDRVVPNPDNRRSLHLGARRLAPGTHRLVAEVTDPADPGASASTLEWTVDATGPTVAHEISERLSTITRPDGSPHYFVRDRFTMKLDPADDQPGWVVAEFRVNGDGWHHYYGWPDAPPGTPFLFTPRGTTIKELVYGSLAAEGLSPQPWETRAPGWGTHTVEYRARDAAGNTGDVSTIRITFMPAPDCTSMVSGSRDGDLLISDGVTCLDHATIGGSITVAPGASLVATGATITGSVTSTGASTIELVGVTIDGDLRIAGTTGSLTLFGSTLRREVALTGNRTVARPVFAGNRLDGALICDDNRTATDDLGAPNRTTGGADGGCRGL